MLWMPASTITLVAKDGPPEFFYPGQPGHCILPHLPHPRLELLPPGAHTSIDKTDNELDNASEDKGKCDWEIPGFQTSVKSIAKEWLLIELNHNVSRCASDLFWNLVLVVQTITQVFKENRMDVEPCYPSFFAE